MGRGSTFGMPSGGPREDCDDCRAAPPRHAAAAMKQTSGGSGGSGAAGGTAKHATTWSTKHSGTSKHKLSAKQIAADKKWAKKGAAAAKAKMAKAKVTAKAKPATHAKAVGLALTPGDVACCAAEALAASLRLQGVRVSDEDVLALYWHTAGDPDSGASIVATLEAAWRFGLGGVRPAWYMEAATGDLLFAGNAPLILGLELPGPHAVLATPDGWWSWGELHDPAEWPDAVVEAAWAVTWA